MGADGTRGAADIVAAGGSVIAQDEATSVVWGMPRSVAQAGLCSAVLPLDQIAPKIIRLFSGDAVVTPLDYDFLRKCLKERSGLVLSADKQYLVESRLLAGCAQGRASPISANSSPRSELAQDRALMTAVVEAMTTNESFFFRDKTPFEHFRLTIMPALLAARRTSRSIRIWCAAASTGQEPYSLAMCLKEMERDIAGWRIELLATDLSGEVLEKARPGFTPSSKCSAACRSSF